MSSKLEKHVSNKLEKPVNILDLPRKYKLSEAEKEVIGDKYNSYLKIRKHAIEVLSYKIQSLQKNTENQPAVQDLKYCLEALVLGCQRVERGGVEGLIAELERFKKGRRPSFGLSRGFGEALYPYRNEEWVKEVMKAVDEIEDYYSQM